MIIPDIALLKKLKSKGKGKRTNILNALSNLDTVFTGFYLHDKDVPKKIMFEKNIEETTKLRRERSHEIERKEQNINSELFK